MICFSIKKLKFSLTFSFFAVIALIFSFEGTGYIFMGMIAATVHELGHIIAMCITDVPPKDVIFYGAGIKIVPNYKKILSFKKELMILSAGSLTNFLIFAMLFTLFQGNFKAELFAVVNLIIGLFNIIPFRHFDGGRIIDLFIMESNLKNPFLLRRVISVFAVTSIIILGVFFTFKGTVNPSFYISLGYIIFSEIML